MRTHVFGVGTGFAPGGQGGIPYPVRQLAPAGLALFRSERAKVLSLTYHLQLPVRLVLLRVVTEKVRRRHAHETVMLINPNTRRHTSHVSFPVPS